MGSFLFVWAAEISKWIICSWKTEFNMVFKILMYKSNFTLFDILWNVIVEHREGKAIENNGFPSISTFLNTDSFDSLRTPQVQLINLMKKLSFCTLMLQIFLLINMHLYLINLNLHLMYTNVIDLSLFYFLSLSTTQKKSKDSTVGDRLWFIIYLRLQDIFWFLIWLKDNDI